MAHKKKPLPSFEELHRIFWYDPATGFLRWRIKACFRMQIGDIAGALGSQGYLRVCINKEFYAVARIIWKMQTGCDPIQVDHRNRWPTDNRWENLRQVSGQSENGANQKLSQKNTSGVKGVCWDKARNQWMVQIQVKGRHVHLGRTSSIESAREMYLEAAKKYFGEFASDGIS